MEKDSSNPEKKPYSSDEDDDDTGSSSASSKNSKKSKTAKSTDGDRAVEESEHSDNTKEKPAFFRAKRTPTKSENNREEVEPSHESESGSDTLSEGEVVEAVSTIVEANSESVYEELLNVDSDSAAEFEALADAIFLEYLGDAIAGNDQFTQEQIDLAYAEAVEDLELPEDSDQVAAELNSLPVEVDDQPEVTETQPDTAQTAPAEEQSVDSQASQPAIQNPTPPAPQSMPNTPSGPVHPNGPPPTPVGSSAGGNVPPVTPPLSPINARGASHNYNSNLAPAPTVEVVRRHRSDMLVGVILGYIVGRRGGRKRTEKKLKPKIKVLEGQVSELNNAITQKEEKIRRMARAAAESTEQIKLQPVKLAERRQQRKEVKQKIKKRQELIDSGVGEKVGKFSLPALNVFRERRLIDGAENSVRRKQVEVMTVVELLEKVKYLVIDGDYLVDLYHQGRIDDKLLRQVTKDFLRGGTYEATLGKNLTPDEVKPNMQRRELDNIEKRSAGDHAENQTENKLVSPAGQAGVGAGQLGTEPGLKSRPEPRSSNETTKVPTTLVVKSAKKPKHTTMMPGKVLVLALTMLIIGIIYAVFFYD